MGKNTNDNTFSQDQDSYDLIAIEDITEVSWAEIREIARVMYDRGDFEGNQFKITISAFFEWVRQKGPNIAIDLESSETYLN